MTFYIIASDYLFYSNWPIFKNFVSIFVNAMNVKIYIQTLVAAQFIANGIELFNFRSNGFEFHCGFGLGLGLG